jgi:hypothetical protein
MTYYKKEGIQIGEYFIVVSWQLIAHMAVNSLYDRAQH